MARGFNALVLGLLIWLGAAAAGMAAQPAEAPDTARQIMVMLRLPAEHFRTGASYSGAYGDGIGHGGRLRIAEQLARERGLTLVDDWPMPVIGVECFVMRVPADRALDDEIATLSRDGRVDSVEPINIYQGRSAPAPTHNDPLFRAQPAARAWRLADLHQVATGRHVRVAVIDSMIDARQPDLSGQVLVSRNFVKAGGEIPEQHGTGVAGIIAAIADNSRGIVGVAPGAELMGLRACWQLATPPDGGSGTLCDSLSLAKALEFAITHDAQVINLSLSGPTDPLLGKLLDAALARGMTVVSAFDATLPGGGFPASHAGVVAVADEQPGPNAGGIYVAPGRNVPTTQPGPHWNLVNGSSYAAAHVSGLFALLRERSPATRGASSLVAAHAGYGGGGGTIDACATLLRATGPRECACAHPPGDAAGLASAGAGGGLPDGSRGGGGAGSGRR
jgi:hypothetical protein